MKNEHTIEALLSLILDDDAKIVKQVEQELLSIGDLAIPHLEQLIEHPNETLPQQRIERLLHKLQYEKAERKMQAWYASEDHDLLTGLWIVSSLQYPSVQLEKLQSDIEQIYYEVWLNFQKNLHPFDQVKIINGILFSKLKFTAKNKNFYSPDSSLLNATLANRKGNPIALCTVYLLVAQKLKLPIYGVNFPNLFILTYKKSNFEQFYINVFSKGLIFSRQEIENYISELHIAPQESFFEPCSNINIIERTLNNLIVSFDKIGEHIKAEEIKTLLAKMSKIPY